MSLGGDTRNHPNHSRENPSPALWTPWASQPVGEENRPGRWGASPKSDFSRRNDDSSCWPGCNRPAPGLSLNTAPGAAGGDAVNHLPLDSHANRRQQPAQDFLPL